MERKWYRVIRQEVIKGRVRYSGERVRLYTLTAEILNTFVATVEPVDFGFELSDN